MSSATDYYFTFTTITWLTYSKLHNNWAMSPSTIVTHQSLTHIKAWYHLNHGHTVCRILIGIRLCPTLHLSSLMKGISITIHQSLTHIEAWFQLQLVIHDIISKPNSYFQVRWKIHHQNKDQMGNKKIQYD